MAEPSAASCLLCGGDVTEPVNLAPAKSWWPLMVTCANEECIAFGSSDLTFYFCDQRKRFQAWAWGE